MVDIAGQDVLAVLTRAPSAGGKTRLFAELGRPSDAELLAALLLDTLDAGMVSGIARVVCFTPASAAAELRRLVPPDVGLISQRGGDLGDRMRHAFDDLLALRARTVVLVGSDLPMLDPALVSRAAAVLAEDPESVVLGPSPDGGYYLVASRRTPAELLRGIAWGSAEVLSRTLDAARAAGRRVTLLDSLADVDTVESLRRAVMDPRAVRTRGWWEGMR